MAERTQWNGKQNIQFVHNLVATISFITYVVQEQNSRTP